MPLDVVVGPPFSGKGRFVREQIAQREEDGELGLVAIDWTAIYGAIIPGAQSQFRDDAVSETGAPRLAGFAYDAIIAAVAARELSGFILTQSPRRAIEIGERVGGRVLEVEADPGDVADRAEEHMRRLRRTVARAALSATGPRCRRAAVGYYREVGALVGRARIVSRGKVGPEKRPFDQKAWERGLTPRARDAIRELKAPGNAAPTPADVMGWVLRNRE